MASAFRAVKVTDHVYWVGAIDWGIRDFHGYSTDQGTTYNAYLVLAEKPTLIDTVKAPFVGEMMSRIASVIEPGKIEYVVSNHSEMDHSGGLPEVIAQVKPEKVFASGVGADTLGEHFRLGSGVVPVKDGQTVSLGDMDLTFIETRMLHWPDSMMSYLGQGGVLFSQDGFGMHLASSERFADKIDPSVLEQEAGKYFANILMPFSSLVTKLLGRVKSLGIPIQILAPDHGPIWRENTSTMPEWYARWAERRPTEKAVIAYDTMWQSTGLMARAIRDGLGDGGVKARVMPLGSCHRSDVVTEVLDAGGLLVGSPTINNGMFPTLADFLAYLRGLKPKNLIGASFGSYGWSGEAVGLVRAELEALGRCRALGMHVAEELRMVCEHD